MEKLIKILKMVKQIPDFDVEFTRRDEVEISDLREYGHAQFKTFSDTEPLECDGNLNACIAYLEQFLPEYAKENISGMDLNEINHVTNNQ